MSGELEEIRSLAREFATNELRPYLEEWDREARLDPAVLDTLGELGFFGTLVPEEYGGMELPLPVYTALLEELSWGEPSVALTVSIHSAFAVGILLRHGSEEQRERWLGKLATGETIGAFALSEEGAGSDPAALETRATHTDEGWVLEGTKKRSEEHTSELQSRGHLVCRLLLEKNKNTV